MTLNEEANQWLQILADAGSPVAKALQVRLTELEAQNRQDRPGERTPMRMKLVEEGTGKDWGWLELPVVPRVGEEIDLTEAHESGAVIVKQVVYDMGEPVHADVVRVLDYIALVVK